jgi:hypothetical protein
MCPDAIFFRLAIASGKDAIAIIGTGQINFP